MIALIGFLGWLILFVIVIAILCCIVPWWVLLLSGIVGFLCATIPWKDPRIDRSKAPKNKPRLKTQKKNEADKNKQNITTRRVNRTNANIGAGTYYQKNDDFDYDRYIAAKREEQAAYDDFIASLDMDD